MQVLTPWFCWKYDRMLSHNVNHDPWQWQRTANQDASKIHEICWNFPRIWSTTLTSTTLESLTSLPFTTLWRKNLAIRCPWITTHLVETWHKYVSRIQKIISRMRSGLSVKTQKVGAISNFGEDVRPQIIFVIKEILFLINIIFCRKVAFRLKRCNL